MHYSNRYHFHILLAPRGSRLLTFSEPEGAKKYVVATKSFVEGFAFSNTLQPATLKRDMARTTGQRLQKPRAIGV